MPELSNNFLKGRMNKDLDDRIVPRGEYRDALNIEVSTSEDADIGTVQNLKGNKSIVSGIFNSEQDSNIYTTVNGYVYVGNSIVSSGGLGTLSGVVLADTFNQLNFVFPPNAGVTSSNLIFSFRSSLLEVGKIYRVNFNIEVDISKYDDAEYTYRVGMIGNNSNHITSTINIENNQLIANADSTTGTLTSSFSNTFYAQTSYIEIYADQIFNGTIKNITLEQVDVLSSTSDNAITIGSKEDTATDTIYNFVHKASDVKLNVYSNSQGIIRSRKLGIVSDVIIAHKPDMSAETSVDDIVFTDVYKVVVAPLKTNEGKLPMSNSGGIPTPNLITGLPCILNSNNEKEVQGIRVGMKVSYLDAGGSNFWAGKDVRVTSVYYDENTLTGAVTITHPNTTDLYNNTAVEDNYTLEFTSDRILKFICGTEEKELNVDGTPSSKTPAGTNINDINIVEDFLYFTDSRNEPKKIDIKRFKSSTKSIFHHTTLTELDISEEVKFPVEEKHITVIKAKPTSAPYLVMNSQRRTRTGYIKIGDNIYNGKGDYSEQYYTNETSCLITNSGSVIKFLDEDDAVFTSNVEIDILSNIGKVNWREGDNIILTGITNNKKVTVRIVAAKENNLQFNLFTVKIVDFDASYPGQGYAAENWLAELQASKAIYERNFVSFAMRYKYDNNEYSAIGPYSEVAFLPSEYSYKAETGFNASMENTLRSLELFDFVPSDIQKDVKAVDIILKDHFSTNAYIIATINKDTTEWNTAGHGNNRGRFEIKSELKGATVPSLQLSRIFDAVPTKAKTQDFIASRLMYGNYTEGYDMVDHGQVKIKFSMFSDFENITGYSTDLGSGISINDLSASCNPFFDENTNSHKYIHNYFLPQSSASTAHYGQHTTDADGGYLTTNTSTSPATNIFCAQDIDDEYNSGTIGNGPKYAKILIPIIPKDEDTNSSTHLFPSLEDSASTTNDEGASGNYQDFNCTHSVFYNTGSDQNNLEEYDDTITPFIYKLPQTGEFIINVAFRANARYFYGPDLNSVWTGSTPSAHVEGYEDQTTRLFKSMPSRIEIHEVDESGKSLGIINDSENLLLANTPFAAVKHDGLASSELLEEEGLNGPSYRISIGSTALSDYRNNQHDESNNSLPYHQLRRKIFVGSGYQLSTANKYIGVFYVHQVSFNKNSQSNDYTPTFNDINTSNGNVEATFTPSSTFENSVRFLIDSTTLSYSISAPLITNNVEIYKPAKTVKSNRSYETGVTYLDLYGRESTVMVSENSNLEISEKFSDKKNLINCCIKSNAPKWATHYKYYIKEFDSKTHNIVMYKAYSNESSGEDSTYVWLSFNSNDFNKVKVDDYLLAKKMHGNNNAVKDIDARFRVLDISANVPSLVGDEGETTPLQITPADASGKFFVKVEKLGLSPLVVDSNGDGSGDTNDVFFEFTTNDSNTSIGAVFEVESQEGNSSEGLFYETSKAYPIKLTNETIHQYITTGDKLEMDSQYDIVYNDYYQSTGIDQWNQNNTSVKVLDANGASSFPSTINPLENNQVCSIYLNKPVSILNINLGGNYVIAKFVKEDGSFVTARVVSLGTNIIKVIPYTHPVSTVSKGALNKVGLPWFNAFTWFNGVESDTIGDTFNGKTLYPYTGSGKQSGFNASDYYPDYGQDNKKHDIIYSQILNQASNMDMTNQFILADKITKKLNSSHGQINKIISRNNDLLVFCEDKILKILSSGKDALFNADGNVQLIASNRVLGQSLPFVGDFGCQHPESIATDDYRVYFVDKARGSVLRLSRDGITQISNKGMTTWFNDNLKRAQSIVGSFDDKKSEYNITIHDITSTLVDKNVYTVSFDESANGWVSFKSFIQENGLSLNNKYYTFKQGRIYLHHSNDILRNNFYSVQANSTVTSLINMQPNIVKSFSVINYEGSQAEILKSLTDDRYDNIKAKSGWSVELVKTDQQEGLVEEFIEKEGRWYNNIKGKKE